MEGGSGAVEFLSVECDMIFEPECDLETECQEDDCQEGGEGNGSLCHTPSPRPAHPNTPPPIDDLFRGRNVGVYRRSDPRDPFILIFDPTLQSPIKEDKDIGCGEGEGEGKGAWSSPEENGEEEGVDVGEESGEGRCRRPVRCQVCRKQFRTHGCLVTHELIHLLPSPGPPPPCPVCAAALPSRAALKIHVRRHFSGRTHQCPTCHQCHLTHTQLMMHQQLHSTYEHHNHHNTVATSTPNTPTLSPTQPQAQESVHTPPECQPKVPTPQEKSHTSVPDLCCDRCDATFSSRSALHSHRRTHRERHRHRRRRRHECPECGSQFRRSSMLKKHRKAEHDV